MNPESNMKRFWSIFLPTPLQAVMSFIVALVVILFVQRQALITHFADGQILETTTTKQLNLQVANILGLSIVGQAAIIFFWAIVGLGAYLIVWVLHNALISARNEVIITTAYTNQKGSRFNIAGMALKIVALIAAVFSIATIPYGLNFWLSLWQELFQAQLSLAGFGLALVSIVGFAAELYLSFILFQVMINRFRS